MKRTFKRFLWNKYAIIVFVILLIALFFIFKNRSSSPVIETTTARITNVIEKVSVTGKILAESKADLAFEKSGVVTSIPHKVGESIKKGDILASLDSAGDRAALASAQAQLAELSRGLRPEEYAADQAAVDAASTTLGNAKSNAFTALRDGYVKAQSSVVNNADIFFTNAQSANPVINVPTQSSAIQTAINQERLAIANSLFSWKAFIDNMRDTDNVSILLAKSENYLNIIKSFMSDLSAIVNNLNPANSSLSQTTINTYTGAMNTGLSTLTLAINAIVTADANLQSSQAAFDQANNQFSLQKAGTSADTIAAQSAKVAQAQAELDKDKILSPIDGTLTTAVPDLGEFVSAGQTVFSVQSDTAFKIETYVPEADIAKVAIGDLASSTLDAYGSYTDFPAQVAAIDPAETILEGVPTYKVTLYFVTPDSRIRSGMTANLEILTHEVDNVVAIPYRALTITATSTTVRVLSSIDSKKYFPTPVTTGLKGSDGMIEISSGLSAGDKVVTYVK